MSESYENIYAKNEERFIDEWKELLRFESVGTDPTYNAQTKACAEWLVKHLKTIGLKSELIETKGQPLVFASFEAPGAKKTVLFYGHYDVQPADPLELWNSPPFQPEIRNGRMYARGAEDNKGQAFYVIKAVQSLLEKGDLRCNLKIILEGEEESGSRAIQEALGSLRDKLRADVLMVCDTGSLSKDWGTVTMGLRGIAHLEARLDGPSHDMHSGVHGGLIPNPAVELARLVATLHTADGAIAIPGYYDGIKPMDPEDQKLANAAPIDLKMYEGMVGVAAVGGEKGLSPAERRGFRPTIEVNGMYSGYTGTGSKTIIPACGVVKISTRIVGGQDPARCLKLIEEHLKSKAHPALKLTISNAKVGGPALLLSSKSASVAAAKRVLDKLFPHETVFMWEGASIPIVAELAHVAGAEALLVGFGLEEDNIHAPNESFGLDQFKKGYLYATSMLQELAR